MESYDIAETSFDREEWRARKDQIIAGQPSSLC